MKTYSIGLYISSFILFILPQSIYSTVDNQLITEMLVTDKDSTFRYSYLYDTYGNKVLETKYWGQTGAWNRLNQTEWFYEGNDCVLQQEKKWNKTDWDISFEIKFVYNEGNLISESFRQVTNGVNIDLKKNEYLYNLSQKVSTLVSLKQNDLWSLSQRIDYIYSGENIDSVITKEYENASVINEYLLKNTYTTIGVLNSQLTKTKGRNDVDWLNIGMVNYYYSSTNKLMSQRNKIWDKTNFVWVNSQMIDYKYNDDTKIISEDYKKWRSMYWDDVIRYEYSYDNQKLVKKSLLSSVYHSWRSLISIVYSNSEDNNTNIIESRFDFWGGETGMFTTSFIPFLFNDVLSIQKGNKIQLKYVSIDESNASATIKSDQHIAVYPNPSNGIYYINLQNFKMISWAVLDLNARMIKKQELTSQSGLIDISDLARGIYILKVNSLDRQYTQKLIKY